MMDGEVEALVKAFNECDLDCCMWHDNSLRELAVLAIETLNNYRKEFPDAQPQ